ncbi:MAG TPA: oligopeptide ABC transporter permease OppB [Stellaceae bacterium]|nr:oligopeptide ABC transporter permease OppB [Stellaceae bacterium]
MLRHLALLLLLLAAPAFASDQILRRGNGPEPQTLDPQKSSAINDAHIEDDLFEGLLTMDAENRILPGAAERWEVSPDGLVYTLHLRPGLEWSNGEALTAEDFVWSFRRAVDPATGTEYGFLYYPVKNAEAIVTGKLKDPAQLGVRAVDPLTFEVTLEAPTAYFPGLLAHHTFFPVNRGNVERDGALFTRPGHLVSNGAFMLKEWVPQSRVVVVRNPHYHDAARVRLDAVEFYPSDNENEEFKRYRAGALDITDSAPVDQMDMIRRDLPSEFIAPPYFGLYSLGFNTTRPPFKAAPGLRNALSMVIDREAIVHEIVKRGERAADGWIPPGVPGYETQLPEWAGWPMERRIAEAQRLYREAGYGPGHELAVELRYNTSENHKKIMIAIAEMWRQALGVEVSLVNEEWKVFLDTRAQRKLTQAYRDSWIGDFADPNAFFSLLLSSSGLNYSGYANPDYDALVNQAAVTLDPATRFGLFEEAERLVLRDAPVVPLYSYVNQHMVKPWVEGYRPNLLGHAYSRDISIGPGRPALGEGSGAGGFPVGTSIALGLAVGITALGLRVAPRLALRRLAAAVPTLFALVTLAFFMIRLAPGGPFSSERAVPPEIAANLDRAYHLDEPLPAQYAHYLAGLLRGDFGPSFSYKDFTVTELIRQGFPISLQLGLSAIVIAFVLGTALGALAALRQNRPADHGVMALAMTGITVPNFVMAPLMTLVFGVWLKLLPAGGWGDGNELRYKILPVIALALPQIAYIARLTRGSMVEVLRADYIRTARAKGLPTFRIIGRHAARAALLPVVSYLGPASAAIVTGSVVVEQIFSVPGIGRYFVLGALNRDYTLVMGVVIFYGVLVILFNLAVDLLYGVLDPKLARR